jgi:hypothetical protein
MLTEVPDVVVGDSDGAASPSVSLPDEIVREGARRMLAAALEVEVAAYIDAHAHELDEQGRRLVVRNGHAQPRQLVTGAGAVEVVAPRVNDKRVDEATGQPKRFSSAILPPWCRKSPKVSDVLPLLYLLGLSGNDFAPALRRHPCSVAHRLESTRQQRRVMIFIRSREDGMIHSVRLPRTTSRSS